MLSLLAMKIFLFLLSGITFLFSQELSVLEKDKGIFGYVLGGTKADQGHLDCRGYFQMKQKCIPVPMPKKYEEVPIKKILLYFYNKKLHSIEIKIEGEQASQTMLLYLQMKYGEGKQKGYAPHYTWQTENILLTYDENLLTHNAIITFLHIPTQKQLEKDYRKMYGM